jgi:hypothetical protein
MKTIGHMVAGIHTGLTILGASREADELWDRVMAVSMGGRVNGAPAERDFDKLEAALGELGGLTDQARREAIQRLRGLREREGKANA